MTDIAFDSTFVEIAILVRDIVIEHNRLESRLRMHNAKDGLV